MYKVEKIDSIDDTWIRGHTLRYSDEGLTRLEATTHWVKLTDLAHRKHFWMLLPAYELFSDLGLSVSIENSKYLQKIWEEDWVAGANFFLVACYGLHQYADDIAKVIINDLSAVANELDLHVERLLDVGRVNQLCNILFLQKKVDKKHTRAIVERLIRLEPIEDILKDPAFARVDNSLVDSLIESTLLEIGDKLDGTDKMLNWAVGQIMKKTQGKADASYVRAKIAEKK